MAESEETAQEGWSDSTHSMVKMFVAGFAGFIVSTIVELMYDRRLERDQEDQSTEETQ